MGMQSYETTWLGELSPHNTSLWRGRATLQCKHHLLKNTSTPKASLKGQRKHDSMESITHHQVQTEKPTESVRVY